MVRVDTTLSEHDGVVIRISARGFTEHREVSPGMRGVVVSAHPPADSYTVEVFDEAGATLDLIEAHRSDLEPIEATIAVPVLEDGLPCTGCSRLRPHG